MTRLWLLWQILLHRAIRVQWSQYRVHHGPHGIEIFVRRNGEEFVVFSLRTD